MAAPQDRPAGTRKPGRIVRQMAVLREGRAVDLRLMGWTYEQIAGALLPCAKHRDTHSQGVPECPRCTRLYADHAGARKAVERALANAYADGADARAQLKQQQLGQIDFLLRIAMRAALGRDWEAVRAATRLLDRRARILGLDAPRRHVVTTELDEQIAELMEELGKQPPVAPAPDELSQR